MRVELGLPDEETTGRIPLQPLRTLRRHRLRGISGIFLTLIASLACADRARAQGGGIEILAGETLFSKGTRISIAYLYEKKSDLYSGSQRVSDPTDSEFRRHLVVVGYTYGWSARLDVGMLLPFDDPQVELVDMTGRTTRGESGFGDLALFGKYRLYTNDGPQRALNVSFISGIEVPSGHTGTDSPEPGSGSWDPFGGLAITNSHGRWRYDGSFFYKWNTEGTGNLEFGDEWSLELACTYRYLHRPYPGASNSARIGVVWQGEASAYQDSNSILDSGSEQFLLRPALGFHPHPAIDISLNVDIPLYQHYDGQQLGYDFRTFLALGYRF